MNSLEDWLRSIGLQAHLRAFIENGIDLDVVSRLNDADLRELGLNLGDRRRFLSAVQNQAATEPRQAAAPPGAPEGAAAAAPAERRQLTVMFCDLVGSVALSQRLDPEELRALIQAYRQTCAAVVERYEGHIARYVGDGILTYFGWPKAHEDDAERSIRAALEIVAAVRAVPASPTLSVHIGIATGPVVVGEQAGESPEAKLAVGTTPNLAARLQALAGSDEVVIAGATRRLVGSAFDLIALGAQALKGMAEPVHAWRVAALSSTEGRFEATRGVSALTPFVGREEELALLQRRWQQATRGEGQVVLLSGEPGIGKSRITQALRERLQGEPHIRLRYQCSPYHSNSALYPVIEQLERAAGFARDDAPEQKLEKLEQVLAQSGTQDQETCALFAALMSLPLQRYPALPYSPQKQRDKTLEALTRQIEALAHKTPLLMVFEDVHWIDPTTQEALELLVRNLAQQRVLLILTHRPEYANRWSGEPHVTTRALSRMSRRLGAQLALQVSNNKALPAEVLEQIIAKTDGVPLFVEELTKAVLESGLLKETDAGYELQGALPALAIPSTIQDSLMARLDKLGAVKEVAQIGACIGREFSYELLAAVAPLSRQALQAALNQLEKTELIFGRGTPPDASYTFKHALIQDAAYEGLLKSRRLAIHRQLADALESRFEQLTTQEPALAARHFASAGVHDKAVNYWLAAANQSSSRAAFAESVSYANKGLDVSPLLADEKDRGHMESMLQLCLGWALITSKGFAAPEVHRSFARAQELCRQTDDSSQMLSVLGGLFIYYLMRADYAASGSVVAQCAELAKRPTAPDITSVYCNQYAAWQELFLGRFSSALAHAETGLRLYLAQERRDWWKSFGTEPGPHFADTASWALWLMGYPGKSRASEQQSIDLAAQAAHPLTNAQVLAHAALVAYFADDPARALEYADKTIAYCESIGIPIRRVEGELLRGWALAELGNVSEGIPLIEKALGEWNQMGARIGNTVWYALLAQTYLAAGRFEDSGAAIRRGLGAVVENGERIWETELRRTEGVLHLKTSPPSQGDAEACFLKAIHVARTQEAKSLELRASVCLAELWRTLGKRKEAAELLEPLYNWFTEGFDTKDLKEAKALLNELKG